MKRKILFALLAVLALLQFFQIDKKPLPTNPNEDLKVVANPPNEIYELLRAACYDCHSGQTNYPAYANFQPLGWWLQGHVRGARQELNFSEFSKISTEDQRDALRHCAEEIEEGKMPLKSYVWLHPEAKLTAEQRQKLLDWLRNPLPADLSNN